MAVHDVWQGHGLFVGQLKARDYQITAATGDFETGFGEGKQGTGRAVGI